MKIKGIVFDMDGTLFDTERVSLKGCKRANKDFGIEFSEDVFVGFMGLPSREIERKYLEMFGQDFDYARYRELKIKYMNEEIDEKGQLVYSDLMTRFFNCDFQTEIFISNGECFE